MRVWTARSLGLLDTQHLGEVLTMEKGSRKRGMFSVERTGTEVPGTLSSIGHTTCRSTNKQNEHQRQRHKQKGLHRTQRTTQTWPEEADRGLNLSAKLSLEAEPSKFLLALGLPVSGSHKWPVNIRIRSGELYVKVFKTIDRGVVIYYPLRQSLKLHGTGPVHVAD